MRRTIHISYLIFSTLMVTVASCTMPAGPVTLYVSTSGNDANDCLSEATACRTLYSTVRRSTRDSTIHIGPGEFAEPRGPEIVHPLTVIGAGSDMTLMRYSGEDSSGFAIGAIGGSGLVTVRDLSVMGAGVGAGPDALVTGAFWVRDRGILVVENCRITDTTIGIRLLLGSTTTIRNCVIESNGSGISNEGDLEMFDVTLVDNAPALGNSGTARITNSTFRSNGSEREDGGRTYNIYNVGDLTITSSTITQNDGINFWIGGGAVTLDRVQFTQNQYSGIDVAGGSLTVRGSLFQNGYGYGISVGAFEEHGSEPLGEVNITHSAIVGNVGSGLDIEAGRVTVQNTTFSGNNTDGFSSGAGILQNGGILFLLDSTVAFNSSYGLLVHAGGSATVRRSVVALNSAEECYLDPRAPVSIDTPRYTCEESWTADALGLGPLTAELGTLVHPLLPDSPLIDAGFPSASCPPNDQRGLARPAGTTCDIGAYESGAILAPIPIFTPFVSAPDDIIAPTAVTPVAASIEFTFAKNAFCRKGPGVLYRDVSDFAQGETAQADARNDDDPRWWRMLIPNSDEHCWVSHTTVEPNESAEGLPVQVVSLELPEAPSGFGIANRVCSPNGYSIKLAWKASSGAEGYTLYRNGEELATLKANQAAYQESPPMNQSYLYELEAFNDNGFAERQFAEDAGCP